MLNDFESYLLDRGYSPSCARSYRRNIGKLADKGFTPYLLRFRIDRLIEVHSKGGKYYNPKDHGVRVCALKRLKEYFIDHPIKLTLKDFVGQIVIKISDQKRYIVTDITANEFKIRELTPDKNGHCGNWSFECISSNPIEDKFLKFEDPGLDCVFTEIYDAYCRTEDARWESYGYWLRKE